MNPRSLECKKELANLIVNDYADYLTRFTTSNKKEYIIDFLNKISILFDKSIDTGFLVMVMASFMEKLVEYFNRVEFAVEKLDILILINLIIAQKHVIDIPYSNKSYCKVVNSYGLQMSLAEINRGEIEFLHLIDFKIPLSRIEEMAEIYQNLLKQVEEKSNSPLQNQSIFATSHPKTRSEAVWQRRQPDNNKMNTL